MLHWLRHFGQTPCWNTHNHLWHSGIPGTGSSMSSEWGTFHGDLYRLSNTKTRLTMTTTVKLELTNGLELIDTSLYTLYLQGFCGLQTFTYSTVHEKQSEQISEGHWGKNLRNPLLRLNSIPHLSIPTHSHSNDSEPQDLLWWIFLPLPLNFISLSKVIPHPPSHLHVQDAWLMEPRCHILQLDKLVWPLLSRKPFSLQ